MRLERIVLSGLTLGLSAALSLTAAPGAAQAEGFGEVVIGLAQPMGDDDYDSAIDGSFKLGLRAGSLGKDGLGFEVGADWTPANDDIGGEIFGQTFDVSWNRFRVLAGLRFGSAVGQDRKVLVFARAGAGLDLVHTSTEVTIAGSSSEDSDNDVGLAIEVGGGALIDVGAAAVGVQIAVPMGFHFDESDQDPDFDYDYTSYDLDVLVTISSGF
jgi:opacity protein-like surface antigen